MNNNNNKNEEKGNNVITSILSKALFDGFSNWIRNYQHAKNIKKTDESSEKLVTIENYLLKVHKKSKENSHKIDSIKTLLVISLITNLVIFILLIILMIVLL